MVALLALLALHAVGGDSVTVDVAFSGTGGTITRSGLYTAGRRPGRFTVTATANGISDTAVVILTSTTSPTATAAPNPLPVPKSAGKLGIPFGAYGTWEGAAFKPNTDEFSLSIGSVDPAELVQRLDVLRASKRRLLLLMTGGAHAKYKTDGVFDMNKWRARMEEYDTPAIKAAVAAAVADGTLIGNLVLDEPHNKATGSQAANSWGPAGTLNKALVDQMCGYVKTMFPTLPVGVVHDHTVFEPEKSYKVCEFLLDQYAERKGEISQYRDDALAMGRRDGIAILFSLNIINGGIQAERGGSWDCPLTTTGGRGTYDPNCRMTAQQVRDWGLVLGPAGCGLAMWRYDPDFMASPENVQAFKDVVTALAKAPAKPCRRA